MIERQQQNDFFVLNIIATSQSYRRESTIRSNIVLNDNSWEIFFIPISPSRIFLDRR